MKKCKECGRRHSVEGLFCPHCGARDWDVQEFTIQIGPPRDAPRQTHDMAKTRAMPATMLGRLRRLIEA